MQTSLYGASKVAGEGMIASYCEGFKFEGYIFRFVSILGERYTHGHIFDFVKSLLADTSISTSATACSPSPIFTSADFVDAMLAALDRADGRPQHLQSGD